MPSFLIVFHVADRERNVGEPEQLVDTNTPSNSSTNFNCSSRGGSSPTHSLSDAFNYSPTSIN